ncbi:MAG: alpha/beta fold hydrolase, partial [Anaerolineales bacterium]|nr:alpha/beta fold hydrolase [Anaerolineales bacterium]
MNAHLHNPHLDGTSFEWAGGPVGVLLLHGLTATTVEVRALAARLHAAGYTVAGPLLPGHGTSPAALNRTTWREWLETAAAAAHRLLTICDHVFVGGESTGAVLALHLAADMPQLAGVLAYAPAIRLQLRPVDVWAMHLLAPFVPALPKGSLDVAAAWQGYPVNPLKAAVQLLRLQRATQRRLPQVTQPVLVVQGAHDTTIHPDSGRIILDGVASRQTALHVMPESSHVVLIDRELEAVVEVTVGFVGEVVR